MADDQPMDSWMRPEEAARYLKTSPSTLAKKRLYGGGPPFCRFGRNIVYQRSELDAHLAARRVASTSDTGRAA